MCLTLYNFGHYLDSEYDERLARLDVFASFLAHAEFRGELIAILVNGNFHSLELNIRVCEQ